MTRSVRLRLTLQSVAVTALVVFVLGTAVYLRARQVFYERVDRTLEAHELIKVKFLDFQDEKHELSETIAEQLHTILIGVVGNVAILYREQSDPDKRKITLPAAPGE